MNGAELEELTYRHVPEPFFERLLRAVFTAHAVASEDCRSGFEPTEATNLIPYYRRAKVEGYMRDAAAMQQGIEAHVVKAPKSNWYHTELRSGPIVITANSVQAPCGPVEKSEFRLTLARDNQLALWDEPEDLVADSPLYALLLRSRSQGETDEDRARYGHLPGSAYIAYPTPDLSDYVHDVNLFEKFPKVVESFMPSEWDAEAKVRYTYRARKGLTA